MAELNASPPNLPLAPAEYDSRYFAQLSNVLRLYFNQLNNPGDIGGATLNLNTNTLPTSADFDTLRSGDVYYDISGGTATSYPLRIKA
jgi:hypothetical protein